MTIPNLRAKRTCKVHKLPILVSGAMLLPFVAWASWFGVSVALRSFSRSWARHSGEQWLRRNPITYA